MVAAERVAEALERIADALEAIVAGFEVAPESPPPCGHPPEAREDFSGMGAPRWRCKACGFSVGAEL